MSLTKENQKSGHKKQYCCLYLAFNLKNYRSQFLIVLFQKDSRTLGMSGYIRKHFSYGSSVPYQDQGQTSLNINGPTILTIQLPALLLVSRIHPTRNKSNSWRMT